MFEDIIDESEEKACRTCGLAKFVSNEVGYMCTKAVGITCALNLNEPYKHWIPIKKGNKL